MISLIFIIQLLLMPLNWANSDYVLDTESTLSACEVQGDFSLALGRHYNEATVVSFFSLDQEFYSLWLDLLSNSHKLVQISFSLHRPFLTYASIFYLHQNLYIPPPLFLN